MAEVNVEKLAEKFSQMNDILDSIKTQNALNIGDTNRTLGSITEKLSKIEEISNDDKTVLVQNILEELRKNLDDKYSLLNVKFTEVETSFRELVRMNETNLTQNQIKDLFDIISTNMSVFSKQVMSQGDILNEITLRIEALRLDSTQNRDAVKSFAQIRGDIEKFNNGFESIILNINSSFEKVVEELKQQNVVENVNGLQKSFEDMHLTLDAVMCTVQIFDKKNTALEELLHTIASREDIESAKEVMGQIIEQNKLLAQSVDNLASVSDYEGLISKLDETKVVLDNTHNRLIEDLQNLETGIENILSEEEFEKFKKDLSKLIYEVIESTNVVRGEVLGTTSEIRNLITVMNSLDFKTIFNKVLNNLTGLESNIKTNIYEVTNKVTQESENLNTRLSGELSGKFDVVNDNIMKIPGFTTEKITTTLNEITNKLLMIQDDVKAANALYTESFSSKYDILADKLNSTNVTLDTISSLGISSLKFNMEDLSQKLEQTKESITESTKYNYNDILDRIKTLSKGLELLDDKVSKPNTDAIQVVLTNVSELTRKVEEFNVNIEKVEFSENINRLKEVLNFMPEIIKESIKKDFTTTIETDITTRIDGLESLVSNITTEYTNSLEDFKNRVADSIQVIKDNTETSDIKLNNSVFEINAMKADIQRIYTDITTAMDNQSQRFLDIQDNTVNRMEELLSGLTAISSGIQEGDVKKVEFNYNALDEKLDSFLDSIKSKFVTGDITGNDTDLNEISSDAYLRIEAKINKLKEQLSFNEMNYMENMRDNTRMILDEFQPLKDKFKTIADEDYQALMGDFKVQLEYFTNKLKNLFDEVEGTENSSLLNNLFAGLASLNNKMDSIETFVKTINENGVNVSGGTVGTAAPVSDENVSHLAETLKSLSTSNLVDLKKGMEAINQKLDLMTAQEKEIDFLSPEKGIEQLSKLNEIISVEKLNALNKLNLLDKLQTLNVLDNIDKIPQINTFLELQSQLKEIIVALDQKINAFYKNMESIDRISDDIKTSFENSKEDMLKSVVKVFEQISFVEEAEDIKDFIDENLVKNINDVQASLIENNKDLKALKHVINSSNAMEYSEVEGDFQNIQISFEELKAEHISPLREGLNAIKEQLNVIKTGSTQENDYNYSMQDVESDIAKLRLNLEELKANPQLEAVTQNIEQLVNFLDGLKFDFTREDMSRFQHDIAHMSDELTDLSSRTNKLILTSEDSRSDIKNSLSNFQMYFNSIYENIKPLSDLNLNSKIENINSTVEKIARANDANAKMVNNVNEKIDSVETNITENIRELKKLMPQSASVIGLIERKFEEQELKIAAMEEKINEFMENYDSNGDNELSKKIGNIEKQLTKLNKSIEKVTSYVDEE